MSANLEIEREKVQCNESNQEDDKFSCSLCDHQATTKNNLKTHIQYQHEGVKYACNQCDKQYSDKKGLRRHIQAEHEGAEYTFNQCNYKLHIMVK